VSRLGVAIGLLCLLVWAGCGGQGARTGSTTSTTSDEHVGHGFVDHAFLVQVFTGIGLTHKAAECAIPKLLDSTSRTEFARKFASGRAEEVLFPDLAAASRPCERRYPAPTVSHHVGRKRLQQVLRHPDQIRKLMKRRFKRATRG
jgi:hypothetical protein